MSTDLQDFLPGYLAEADEHLIAATRHLTALEESARRGMAHPRAVRELFRSLHTLKGLSAMIGVGEVVDLAHEMESVFRNTDRSGGRLAPGAVDLLIQGLRAIEERVRALAERRPIPAAPPKLLEALASLQAVAQTSGSGSQLAGLEDELLGKLSKTEIEQLALGIEAGRRALRLDFAPSTARAAAGSTITHVRERLSTVAEIVKVVPRTTEARKDTPSGLVFSLIFVTDASDDKIGEVTGAPTASLMEITASGAPGAGPSSFDPESDFPDAPDGPRRDFVRVDVARLDDTLERLSALIVNRFALARAIAALAASGVDVRELTAVVNENGRRLRDLRSSIMRARLVPLSELLSRVPLVVRGAARATGKKVKLDVQAGSAELDKGVAERVFPAIVHLIRNAVDHAIEAPDERRARGKPEEGRIEVRCGSPGGNRLEITVSDDGRGVDRKKVGRRAGKDEPATDAELLDLIARPGLSTSDTPTQTSGRGMGMDIVKRTVEGELGGQLTLRTEEGRGTTFTLRVPLTITIVDAFSLSCGREIFVVPVASVDDIVDVEPSQVVVAPSPASGLSGMRMLQRRGQSVPLLSLARLLEVPRSEEARPKAIIVRREEQSFAFEVDRMLGQQEVVVRPLGDPLVRSTGVTGSTDLGDGRPVLVLDLIALSGALMAAA